MNATALENVNTWLNGNYDAATKDAIEKLQKENPAELEDSFYRNLEFGKIGRAHV